ncbi:hypothetical protein GCM10007301_03250 [Azorhizobium oxalatiphilum]|uniref:Uncharacterized protein n=1 Tax=Azorhizobium oxalatiphilum TaxID=980631 RepID=A0A917BKS9_9HYPH|nr:hypothetical protein [Azorhizobium oxalatiphilum]GGF47213.1 hypothetical protein GCM10007301_03250 [Azorhizobium oxalatiphilum]
MDFVVGLWSVATPAGDFTASAMQQRISDLERALTAFRSHVNRQKLPSAQKIKGIFVAPEYYLAQVNAMSVSNSRVVERTISVPDRNSAVGRIAQISKTFPEILIIPGTIAWKKTFARAEDDYKLTDRRKRALDHMGYFFDLDSQQELPGMRAGTLSHKGVDLFRPSATDRTHMIAGSTEINTTVGKKTFHHRGKVLYYMRNTAYVFLDGQNVYSYHKSGDYYESVNTSETVFIPSRKPPVKVLPVREAQEMSFGFEICLDHNIGMLQRHLKEQGIPAPDFHIISSATVTNDTNKMCMRNGGYVLHASSYMGNTGVFANRRGLKTEVEEDTFTYACGYPLRIWTISVARTAFLADVKDALDTYEKKSWWKSAESKDALAKLRQLLDSDDEAGLKRHLDWYLGKSQIQPDGSKGRVPSGKKLHTELSTLHY